MLRRSFSRFSPVCGLFQPTRGYCVVDNEEKKIGKKRYLFVVSYLGTEYKGIQLNTSITTIQGTIHDAIYKLGWIPQLHHENPADVSWNQCSRTDKGVHALFNLISCKMRLADPDAVIKLNSALPKDIRILDIFGVPRSLDAKKYCHHRTYEYMLPTHLLKPSMRHPKYNEKAENWKMTEDDISGVNDLCRLYVGTRKYHNYTKKLRYSSDSAQRLISNFLIEELIVVDGIEFAKFRIEGQSFLYHQIRKMIGLVTSMYRDGAPMEVIPAVHKGNYGNWLVPLAPGPFLMLSDLDYDQYNQKARKTGGKAVYSRNYRADIINFRNTVLYPSIAKLEKEEGLSAKFEKESLLQMDYDHFLVPYLSKKQIPPPNENLHYLGKKEIL